MGQTLTIDAAARRVGWRLTATGPSPAAHAP